MGSRMSHRYTVTIWPAKPVEILAQDELCAVELACQGRKLPDHQPISVTRQDGHGGLTRRFTAESGSLVEVITPDYGYGDPEPLAPRDRAFLPGLFVGRRIQRVVLRDRPWRSGDWAVNDTLPKVGEMADRAEIQETREFVRDYTRGDPWQWHLGIRKQLCVRVYDQLGLLGWALADGLELE